MGRLADIERIVFSYKPQATIAHVTNEAVIRLDRASWALVLQVHDSVGIEARDEDVPRCISDVRAAFDTPITLHGQTFTIPIDISTGPNWGKLQEVKYAA
jgi:DNA polymerase I-like protein with 3'-5' exonuclease and polymerase domains